MKAKKILGDFELYVMLAVARLGDDAYGGALRREIESRTERSVAIGALYSTLDRLGDKGYLSFRVEGPESGRPGRARKYCRLTPAGAEALRHSSEMLRRMMEGVQVGGEPLLGQANQ
ncbi:MAG: PadR family transcriptional regulator [Thermoanaerobaculia bacterium]|nr:PadR family transcriptional regulator [Thermoanaerobaculia bacterium]